MTDQGYRRVIRVFGITLYVSLVLLLVGPQALPADPPAGKVRIPTAPVVPQPMPGPDAALTLTPELVLCVDSDIDCVVVCSPKGKLKVTPAKGPVTVRGRFVDGNGTVEMRTFAGPFVWFVEAAEPGECELLALPVGGKEPDLLRRRIVSQTGPQPPPKPDPTPDPKPKPPDPKPAPIPADGLHVLIVYESADLSKYTTATNGILFGKNVRDHLNAKCATGPDGKTKQWRIYDKDTDGYADSKLWGDALKRADGKPTPYLIVSNGKDGWEGPLPANSADFLALVAKYIE